LNPQRVLFVDMHSRPASLQRAATRIDARLFGLILGLLSLLALAALLYLSQAGAAAELRYAVRERERTAQRLQGRVAALRCEIAQGESITSLEARAQRLGLVDAPPGEHQVEYEAPAPAVVASPLPAASSAQPEARPTPWEWLFSRLWPRR